MRQLPFLILAIVLMASTCESEWIADPVSPGLPKYTEKGVGVAGAMVNGELWTAILDCSWGLIGSTCDNDLRINPHADGNLYVKLDGNMRDGRKIQFYFTLAGMASSYTTNKKSLNNKKFSIDGTLNKVQLMDSGNSCIDGLSGVGQIHFVRVNDVEGATTNFSGTFGFEINDPICGDYEVYYGRFDYPLWD
jgi:hypothetical protein